jgi:predicted tellurium resistance membrane protein TerC
VIFGATLLVGLMERWPVIITLGAGLLGYVAGEMAWEDPAIASLTMHAPDAMKYAVALACAALVVGLGRMIAGGPARIAHAATPERRPRDSAR